MNATSFFVYDPIWRSAIALNLSQCESPMTG